MPRNGSGVVNLVAAATVTSGTTISSVDFNATTADIEAVLNDVNPESIDINGGAIDGVTIGTNSPITEAQFDNLNLNGNTLISTDTNGAINLTPNGSGSVVVSKVDIAAGEIDGVTIGTNSPITELQVDNINFNGNAITTTTGNLELQPNGAGNVCIATDTLELGEAGAGMSITNAAADQLTIFSGGNTGITGANLVLYGPSHATLPSDMRFRRGTTDVMEFDGATGDWFLYEDDGSTEAATLDASTGILDIAKLAIGGTHFTPASFTPTLAPNGGAFTVTYDQQDGIVVPLGGNLAYISIRIRTNSIAQNTATGVVVIDGAPNVASGFAQALTLGPRGTWSNKPERALMNTSGNVELYQSDDSQLDVSDLDYTGSSKNQIFVSGFYRI